MSTGWIITIVVIVVITAILAVLYFLGKKAQKKQNEQQRIAIELLEKQTQAVEDAAAKRIAALERETAVLEAQGASAERIERKRLAILEERKKASADATMQKAAQQAAKKIKKETEN